MGKEYLQQLRDPRWQKKRLEILNRDNFTCQYCLCKDKELQVHHRYYDKDKLPWEYDDDCFITLCKDCHEEETIISSNLYPTFMIMVKQLKINGFTSFDIDSIFSDIMDSLSMATGKMREAIYEIKDRNKDIYKNI